MVDANFWRGKKVFLTGHTGFKGGWLTLWLHELGAKVSGYALPPATNPSFFEVAGIDQLVASTLGDIRDAAALTRAVQIAEPEIIFHLAAQPLVSEGYRDPVGTYQTNVIGTLNLLEAARRQDKLQAIVVITSDKCYENRESHHPYRETDPLGGYDPYSSSKACTEILAHSWRRSFFADPRAARIATARTGNVIGGGDWAENRLLPDLLKAFTAGLPATLRHPESVRPWQHVLDPLAGYLRLAECLCSHPLGASAWNFGPEPADCVRTAVIADALTELWPTPCAWERIASSIPHEAGQLRLDASLAKKELQWQPNWPLQEALQRTVDWHLAWLAGQDMQAFSRQQILSHSPHTPTS